MNKKTEISYAIRNFIENAIKFAKSQIEIEIDQNKKNTNITISDDSQGFQDDVISNLGQPYLKSEKVNKNKKGMGLGVFISKSLLERYNTKVMFHNKKNNSGAVIKITWINSQMANL